MATLKDALLLMEKNGESTKNVALFSKCFRNSKFEETTLLIDYIRYVYDNTEQWFREALVNAKMTQRAFRSVKTPLNVITKQEKYVPLLKDLDQSIVKGLPKKFTQTIKVLTKRLEEEKTDDDYDSGDDENTDDTISVVISNNSANDKHILEPQDNDTRIEELTMENHKLRMDIFHLQNEKQGIKSLLLDLLVVRGDDQKFYEFVEKIIKKYV